MPLTWPMSLGRMLRLGSQRTFLNFWRSLIWILATWGTASWEENQAASTIPQEVLSAPPLDRAAFLPLPIPFPRPLPAPATS